MLVTSITIITLLFLNFISFWAFIGLGFIIIIIGSIWKSSEYEKEKRKKKRNKTQQFKKENSITIKIHNEDKLLNHPKGIMRFEMKGMYYQYLSPSEAGSFIGTAECDYNEYDKYAVAIYSDTLLGFVPKNNRILHESIEVWHEGKVFAWGHLNYDKYDKSWSGYVYIPVGCDNNNIKAIQYILNVSSKFEKINKRLNDKSIIISEEEMFNVLDQYLELNNYEKTLDNNCYWRADQLPDKVLNSFAFKLQKEKKWTTIVQLEKYMELINKLDEKQSNPLKKRIERAKQKIKQ